MKAEKISGDLYISVGCTGGTDRGRLSDIRKNESYQLYLPHISINSPYHLANQPHRKPREYQHSQPCPKTQQDPHFSPPPTPFLHRQPHPPSHPTSLKKHPPPPPLINQPQNQPTKAHLHQKKNTRRCKDTKVPLTFKSLTRSYYLKKNFKTPLKICCTTSFT